VGHYALRDKALKDIDQIKIDNAARELHPDAPATTLNRMFYTPVSAVLKRAGVDRKIKRPKGWRGSKANSWLQPEPAFAIVREAYGIEYEFGLFCELLLYTGMRLSDPVKARLRDLHLDEALLYIPDTKNGEPRPVHLTPRLVRSLPNGASAHQQAAQERQRAIGEWCRRAVAPWRRPAFPRAQSRRETVPLRHIGPPAQDARTRHGPSRRRAAAAPARLPHLLSHLRHLDEAFRRTRHLWPHAHRPLEGSAIGRPLQSHRSELGSAPGQPAASAGQRTESGEYSGNEQLKAKKRVVSILGAAFTRERSKVRSLVRPPFTGPAMAGLFTFLGTAHAAGCSNERPNMAA
jgi:integrase